MGGPDLAMRPAVPDTAERTAHIFTFDGCLRFWADDRPGRVALDTGEMMVTFAELDRITAAIATGLADLGIAPGDRIVWQGNDAWPFFALLFAAARSGVVMVPVAPDQPPDAARAIADDAWAKAVFLGPTPGAHARAFAGLCGLVRCFDADAARGWIAGQMVGDFPLSAPNAPVLQIHEGRDDPRGVVLSHCNLLALRKAVLGHALPHVVPDALDRLPAHPAARQIARGQLRYIACGPRPASKSAWWAPTARSASVMLGYWTQPQANAAALTSDGWLITGDRGFVAASGILHIT